MKQDREPRPLRRVVITWLWVLAAFFLYAYAVDATRINLREPLLPQRQNNLIGLLRQLARPDLFEYRLITRSANISLRMPCPEDIRGSQVTVEGRLLVLAPNCATTTQDLLTLTGEGFQPFAEVVVGWHPTGSTSTRRLAQFKAGADGRFSVQFTMPDIRPSDEPQRIEVAEVLERRIVGVSSTAEVAFDRIIETVLMALMASTIGTILAVPISFIAARNLMKDVSAPLAAIMAAIVALPIGGWLAGRLAAGLVAASEQLAANATMGVSALVVAVGAAWAVLRLGPQPADPERVSGLALPARAAAAVLLTLLALAVLGQLGVTAGLWLDERLGPFGFIGYSIYVLSDLTRLGLPWLAGLAGLLAAASLGSRFGQEAVLRLDHAPARILTLLLAIVGTAMLIFGLVYAANWLCLLGICRQIPDEPQARLFALAGPAAVGGLLAGLYSLLRPPNRPVPIGMSIYTGSRAILNALRSIEPVIIGFVFVVWVGIGPFAGIMALTLHSIADLGKLFSEQVENIAEGPREAVRATGANQVQTIAYAVVPQVVPHYIAFIFYRWDINVRMSTIIGFVGGGGIGLVLQRFTNLTQYSQASVMILAIAVVVALLDYVSSRIRTRID